jgi:serine phosphatase RsbU (regulator of sigma subunit)
VISDLADIQRAILVLGNQTSRLLATSATDFTQVDLQRALLNSQLRLALSEARDNSSVAASMAEIRETLEEYDAQMAALRAEPTAENLATLTPFINEIVRRLERQSRALYSQEESTFFSTISRTLEELHTIQTLLLGLGGLLLVFSVMLILSLRRTVSSEFERAYHLLASEVVERKQAQEELSTANENLQILNHQLQEELTLARKIQQGLLPPAQPNWRELDVVCHTVPAREVGGDFYAYHGLGDSRFALAVGDVSGKGLSAALMMATCLAYFDSALAYDLPPSSLLNQLNHALAKYTKTTRQNCALCYVEINGMTLHTANAGCVPPFIRRANGEVEELEVAGLPLGVMPGFEPHFSYRTLKAELAPGDLVILTSDGVVEAHVTANQLFGFERLSQAIAAGPGSSAQAMVEHLKAEVKAFTGNAEPHDDLTIVVLQIRVPG